MRRLAGSRIPLPVWTLIGVVGFLVVVAAIFFGPSKVAGKTFTVKAVFRSEAQLGFRSPVRIAGVKVGKVTSIEPVGNGSDAAVVTMELQRKALPIHSDARARIHTRLLLEGNFFVDLQPGTPAAPAMQDGDTISASRTSGPVQLDRVLSDLPQDDRTSLRTVIQGLGQSFGGEPASGEAATEDPSSRGETAGESLRDALTNSPEALRGIAVTSRALTGQGPHDLSGLVSGTSRVTRALASREDQLSDLVTHFNTTMGAFAGRQAQLRSSVARMPRVLATANHALRSADRAFPATRAIALEARPGLRELPATIDAAFPWMDQVDRLLAPSELGGVLDDLSPSARDLTTVVTQARPLIRQVDSLTRCLLHNVLPTADMRVSDPPAPTGPPVFYEFFQVFTAVASATQNFDGNGRYIRAQAGGGDFPMRTSELREQGAMLGNGTRPPLGTRPAYPGNGKQPPIRPEVSCSSNKPPDLNSAKTGGTP